jgi:hypothetical protein
MQKHLITYDLLTPGKDYSSLITAIKAYGSWAHICESCWAIKSGFTDAQIRDSLMKHIDNNDKLFVCAFDGWASVHLDDAVVKWLKD